MKRSADRASKAKARCTLLDICYDLSCFLIVEHQIHERIDLFPNTESPFSKFSSRVFDLSYCRECWKAGRSKQVL